jgi:alkylation response protein AidB-like acyl-CoA dehydrogenase
MNPTESKSYVKGGEFIIKETDASTVYIPEEGTEEQNMVRQMVKDFVDHQVRKRGHLLEEQISLLKEASNLGLLGSHIPEAYGGLELDTHSNTIIMEELGKGDASFNTSLAAHTGIGMLPIWYFGTEDQKKKYLPLMANGDLTASYCLTEPGSGSDALAAKTRADLNQEGTHYLLNGQKMWISNAGFAKVFIVFAQIEGSKFTGFIVDRDTPGLTLGAEEHKMGIKGSSTRQVFFENAPVPVANILGEIGKGHHIAFNVLNIGRFKLGAMAMGGCKMGIETSVKYANERIQFGQPISSFGAIKAKIGEMAIRTLAIESMTYRISDAMQHMKDSLQQQGKNLLEATLEAAEQYSVECAIIKVLGSEQVDFVVDEMLQIHGGYGYSEEYPAARAYRDARINRIYEGTNEINRMLMVNMILKKAMKGELDLIGPAWAVQKELTSFAAPEVPEGTYGEEDLAIKNMKKILLMVAGAAAKGQMDGKYDLKNEQEVLMHIANIAMEVYLCESLLLRLKKLEILDKKDKIEVFQSALRVLFSVSTEKISGEASEALSDFAEGDELKIMLMGVKRFTKYPTINRKQDRRKVADYLIQGNGYNL